MGGVIAARIAPIRKESKMSHDLEFANGRYSFAFTGDRSQIWHHLGQELSIDATRQEWLDASGFNYRVEKVPAIASLHGAEFDHIDLAKRFVETDQRFLVRTDTGNVLGFASDGYQVVQPAEVWDWFENYITVDERFHVSAAGVLSGGSRLWATAAFNGETTIAGDAHKAHLLMSTSFDTTAATINQATMTRVVCRNTLRMAHSDKRAMIKTRHSTRFNGKQVAKELAQVAQSFADYKLLGDAMAQAEMTREDVSRFFKEVLEIPFDAKREDVSTRKMNQFSDLSRAYTQTKGERNTAQDDVWTALQAVTRYVDHDRSTRAASVGNDIVARFDSGTFGSGDALKGKAMEILLPRVRDKVLVAA